MFRPQCLVCKRSFLAEEILRRSFLLALLSKFSAVAEKSVQKKMRTFYFHDPIENDFSGLTKFHPIWPNFLGQVLLDEVNMMLALADKRIRHLHTSSIF